MAEPARRMMTEDEFLLWCLDQEERCELENGFPVKMMGDGAIRAEGPQRRADEIGANNRHDQIVINLIVSLGQQLKGSGCRPATADIAVKTRPRHVRRPDVTVTCDPDRGDTYDAEKARMVVEVLSPSNRGIRWQRKLDEYRQRAGLNYILLVESERVEALLLRHASDDAPWEDADFEGRDAVVELPTIGCRLPLSEVDDGVVFDDV